MLEYPLMPICMELYPINHFIETPSKRVEFFSRYWHVSNCLLWYHVNDENKYTSFTDQTMQYTYWPYYKKLTVERMLCSSEAYSN